LPVRLSPEGYLETIPDLLVEIRKNEADKRIASKVKDYLKAGVKVVWVADPQRKTVTAYRRGQRPKVFKETDTLTVEDVIPGFRASVARLFDV
jgi:Uma2 family endonuclease